MIHAKIWLIAICGLFLFGCTQPGMPTSSYSNSDGAQYQEFTFTAEQLAQNPEQYLSDGQKNIFKYLTVKAAVDTVCIDSNDPLSCTSVLHASNIKANGTLVESIHKYMPGQEYKYSGVLFKNDQNEYEFWLSSSDAPLAGPEDIATVPNPSNQ